MKFLEKNVKLQIFKILACGETRVWMHIQKKGHYHLLLRIRIRIQVRPVRHHRPKIPGSLT
jgi:hypothetical protein